MKNFGWLLTLSLLATPAFATDKTLEDASRYSKMHDFSNVTLTLNSAIRFGLGETKTFFRSNHDRKASHLTERQFNASLKNWKNQEYLHCSLELDPKAKTSQERAVRILPKGRKLKVKKAFYQESPLASESARSVRAHLTLVLDEARMPGAVIRCTKMIGTVNGRPSVITDYSLSRALDAKVTGTRPSEGKDVPTIILNHTSPESALEAI